MPQWWFTYTPRLCASSNALAIGADVKLYAWTSTEPFAFSIWSMIAAVQPPHGEK